MVFDYLKFQEFLFNTFQSKNVRVKSAGSKVDLSEKCALSFFTWWSKYLTNQTLGEGVQIGSPGRGCNGCSIL